MKEGIDYVAPFTGIEQLHFHPCPDHIRIRIRERKREQGGSHFPRFFVSFKMIIINPLNQRSPVFHPECVRQSVKEKQKQIRTGFRIFIFDPVFSRILVQVTGTAGGAVNAHGIPNREPDEYYRDLAQGQLRDYRTRNSNRRDDIYFCGMYLLFVLSR